MLIPGYLKKQVAALDMAWLEPLQDLSVLKRVAGLQEILFTSSTFLCSEEGLLTTTYPVRDQTEDSRQSVLQVAASLASAPTSPMLFRSIAKAAHQVGLPIREMEVDATAGLGVVGKLDRTWYILGDAASMQSEGVELGMATATLAQQIETEGKYPLFLAMQGPKRLLAVFACQRQLLPHVDMLIRQLHQLGIRITLYTEESPIIAQAFYTPLPALAVVSVRNQEEKTERLQSRANESSTLICWPHQVKLYKECGTICVIDTRQRSGATLCVPQLDQISDAIITSRELLQRLRRRFFWCKI